MRLAQLVLTVMAVLVMFFGLAALARRLLDARVGWIRSAIISYLALLAGSGIVTLVFRDTSLATAADSLASGTATTADYLSMAVVVVLLFAGAFAIGLVAIMIAEILVPTGSIPSPLRVFRGVRRGRRETRRYLQILWAFARHGTRGAMRRARQGRSGDEHQLADALRDGLSAAGVTFVKFGQTIASRRDLVPAPVADALASLQSDVPPAPWQEVEKVVVAALGGPIHEHFASFDSEPLASASVGQVHAARLADGREVVVKVQRLGARRQVEDDLSILDRLAHRAAREEWGRALGVQDLADGFAASLREELDYRIEAENTLTVRAALLADDAEASDDAAAGGRVWAGAADMWTADGEGEGGFVVGEGDTAVRIGPARRSPLPRVAVKIPDVLTDLSGQTMLVMERLTGTGVDRAGDLLAAMAPERRTACASRLLSVIIEQVLVSGTFHADLHPGNVLVTQDGSIGLLDFGSVGRLGEPERMGLAALLLAIDADDPIAATQSLIDLLDPPAHLDRRSLEREIGQFVTRVRGVNRTSALFTSLFKTVVDAGFKVPGQIAAAFRTFTALEGTLLLIDPAFDLVTGMRECARPVTRKIVTLRKATARATVQLAVLAPELERLPRRVTKLVDDMENGRFTTRLRTFPDPRDRAFIDDLVRYIVLTLVATAAIIGSVVLITTSGGPVLAGGVPVFPVVGAVLALAGTFLAIRVLVFALRQGRHGDRVRGPGQS